MPIRVPGWLYNLLLIAAYAVLETLGQQIPMIPELAGEWYVPILLALVTAGLSWIAATKQVSTTRAASEKPPSTMRKFWYGS